jgi:tRNA(Ile)-lysidine synthase
MQPLSEIARRVRQFADAHDLLPAGSTVVVAVSGGPDSVALLHVLRELAPASSLSLVVAHFQHGLRGAESVGDESFVELLSRDLGLRYERGEAEPPVGGSVEARARAARYRFLEGLVRELPADRVALGHTADDQVETVLLHLGRGAGIRGISGMLPRRRSFVRPLLGVWRHEVIGYLERLDYSYRVDSSNLLPAADRNRVRAVVLPAWRQAFGEWVVRAVLRSAGNLQDLKGYIEYELQGMREAVCTEENGGAVLDIGAFRQYHEYLQQELLLRLAEEAGAPGRELGRDGVERLLQLCDGQRGRGATVIPGGVTVARRGSRLHVGKRRVRVGPFCFRLRVPGTLRVTPVGLTIRARVMDQCPAWAPGDGVRRACFPRTASANMSCVTVRNRRPGDKIRLRRDVRKTIKKLLHEAGVEQRSRSSAVVVAAAGEPLWIVGLRSAWVDSGRSTSEGYVGFEVRRGPGLGR